MSWLHSIVRRYRVSEDPLRTLRRIELVALLLLLLLCLQLVFGGFQLASMSGPEPVQPASDSLQVPQVLGPVVVASEDRNEIITRPLFWEGRQPVDEVAPIGPDPDDKPGSLKGIKLVGVFGSGEQAGIIALVKGKKQRILVGESLEGWKLKAVKSGEIVLKNGDQREKLALERGAVVTTSPAAEAAKADMGRPVRQYTQVPSAVLEKPVQETPDRDGVAAEKQTAKPVNKLAPEQGLGLGPR